MSLGWGEDNDPQDGWGGRRNPEHRQQQQRSEETYHRRRNSPILGPPHYSDVGEEPRHREAFRENLKHYEDRRGQQQPQHNRNYAKRELGWRQDPERGSRERFRDRSPLGRDRSKSQRGRGQGPSRPPLVHRARWTPNNQQHINRNRREMDGSPRSGYEWEEQRYSADERREGFYRNNHEPHKFEKSRNEPIGPPRREQYSSERDIHRQRTSRSLSHEDLRGGHFEEKHSNDGFHEERNPMIGADYRPDYDQNRNRPANWGGARGNFNSRGHFNRRGRGSRGSRPQLQRVPKPANEQPRFRDEDGFYDKPEHAWEERDAHQAWREEDSGTEMPNISSHDLEMQLPQKQWGSNETKPNMMVITEETLTIKVDMSRPVNKNSMLYSADRPLSLDLVHVGRQRLDFLSSSQHPGANRENTVQTGTFAQEVITLVHQVKEQYFGGQGVTLSQRFSGIKKKEESESPQEMTLNKRFSSNRGFNVNYDSLTDHEQPLFSKQGPLQLLGSPQLRDPDDLRYDLEKRRLERLEGVKVTIAGQSQPQHPPQTEHPPQSDELYSDNKEMDEEFSQLSEEPQWRPDGAMGSNSGGPFSPFRRNNRQMRRPNYRYNSRGQNW